MPDKPKPPRAYIETRNHGRIVQVRAVDAVTGLEVSFQAPAGTPRSTLERLAVNKLDYVTKRQDTDRSGQ